MTSPIGKLMGQLRAHVSCAEVFELLELAQGADEFEQGLALVRDCFAESDTVRNLTRAKLRGLMHRRRALLYAYEASVMKAAADRGLGAKTFLAAAAALGDEFTRLRGIFEAQINELMGRGLKL